MKAVATFIFKLLAKGFSWFAKSAAGQAIFAFLFERIVAAAREWIRQFVERRRIEREAKAEAKALAEAKGKEQIEKAHDNALDDF